MTYPSVMTYLELGRSNTTLLRIVADLAERFHSRVIGITACQPMQVIYADGGYVSGDLIQQDREAIEQQMRDAEAEFRSTLGPRVGDFTWRSVVTYEPLSDYVANEARAADLVVVSASSGSPTDMARRFDLGAMIMQVGRPLLVVPDVGSVAKLDRVMIAWKDTPEARRAAMDALPLLRGAAHVAVVEVADTDDLPQARAHMADVVSWLACHGVPATGVASASTGNDGARLNAIAIEHDANLLVAGAYGHSRLREWAFGGVTRDVLLSETRCSLLSH